MKLARFHSASGPRVGLVDDGDIYDLAGLALEANLDWAAQLFTSLRSALLAGEAARELAVHLAERAHRRFREPLASQLLLAPFEAGSKLLCHVINYRDHAEEANLIPPERPFFFVKLASSPVHPGETIRAHASSQQMDYEAELGVVIGRTARDVAAEDAYRFIAGYTVVNDVSFRDLQFNAGAEGLSTRYGKNWTQGKGLDDAAAIGPWVVTSDELAEPHPLKVTARVNGKAMVQASTGDMIFKVPELVSSISTGMTLFPGDIIATGAPASGGTGTGDYLRPGDQVECEVESIGVLKNEVGL